MNFPRCCVAIDKKYELPPLETIRKWAQTDYPVYVQNVSEFVDDLHIQTVGFLEIHYLIHSRADDDVQMIIFHGKAVSSILLMALGSHLKKVYWADSEEHINEINKFAENIEYLEIFEDACRRADLALSALTDTIRARTGSGLAGEDAYWRSVSGREHWGNETEAKIVMRKIARDITRAGVLRRIDLEDEPAELKEAAT
jgi:hypothetical protein